MESERYLGTVQWFRFEQGASCPKAANVTQQ